MANSLFKHRAHDMSLKKTELKNSILFCKEIINRVSRTFAISIRFLPGNLGLSVLTGYLLCRIADTIEDDSNSSPKLRQALLQIFQQARTQPEKLEEFIEKCRQIQGDANDIELLNNAKKVFVVLNSLPIKSADIVWRWTCALSLGMEKFIVKYPNGIYIQTLDEYHEYCYYVAGTVGHMLTELFSFHSPWITQKKSEMLLEKCETFGEALQSVNILKDVSWDYDYENEIFIPQELLKRFGSSQSHILNPEFENNNYMAIQKIIDIANKDIATALEYYYAIPRPAVFIRFFCLVPVAFAIATLREIKKTHDMLHHDGVVKISRAEVKKILFTCALCVSSNSMTRHFIQQIQEKPYI